VVFHDSVKKVFFQNTKISDISPQIIDFKNLDDSVVIFPALQTSAVSLTSVASATSLAYSHIFSKKLPVPDGLVITETKITNTGHFLWNGSLKIQYFTNIWYLFLSEAVEASLCYFFENWLMKLKFPNLRNDTFIIT
jgi:hypothetical protein